MTLSVESADEARLQLYDIMTADQPVEQKIQQALDLGAAYLDVDNAHLTRINQDTGHWEAIASTDDQDGTIPPGLSLDLSTTYCRRVLADGGTIALHDAPEQGWADDPAFEAHGLHCYHGTPITVDGAPYGTVCFVSETPREQPFDQTETLFAELIARLLEHQLERRRHEIETTRRANSVTVLSRVLRHNLRNDMTVVRGHITQLADRLDDDLDDDTLFAALFDQIDRIIDLSDKARKLETVVSTQYDRQAVALAPLLDRVTTDVALDHPDATVTVGGDTDATIEAMPSLELALGELLENAAKHAGPDADIAVDVAAAPDTVSVTISDDGPGLPPDEQTVLAEGEETPLVHGSGLGLWMVYWIVTSHDGTVTTTVDDGTTVTITVPHIETDGGDRNANFRALERGRDRFEAVFQESFDAMVIVNDDRHIIDANQHAATLLDTAVPDLRGRRLGEFAIDESDADAVWEGLQAAGHHEGRVPLARPDGTDRVVEFAAAADIIPGQHLLVGRDVTERIEREQALQKTTDQLEAVLGTVDAAIFIKDTDGRYQLMNARCRELLDIDPTVDVQGLTDDELFPPDVAEEVRAADQRVIDQGEPVEVEEAIPTPEGTRTFLTKKSPLVDDHGMVTGVCAVSTDITDRIEREQTLQETTNQLEAVVAASPDPILAIDEDGIVQLWNDAAEDVFGYPAEEVLGESIRSLELHTGEQRSAFEQRFARVLAGETFTGLELERTASDGDTVHLRVSTAPLRDADGSITGVVAVMKDITDQKERERVLARRERRYHTLAEQFPNGAVVAFDHELRYRSANGEAFEDGFLDSDEIEGRHVSEVFDDEAVVGQKRAMYEAALDGETVRREMAFGGRDYQVTAMPVRDDDGAVVEGLVVTHDVTEHVEREAALDRQNEQLEELASLLSHDLRNPLNVLAGALEQAEETGAPEHFEDCYWALERIETLVEDQLALARAEQTVTDREPVALAAAAEECWRMIEAADATLAVETDRTVGADPARLRQLLENLFRNAVEHGGENVTVVVGDLGGGFYVADDGPGIPADEREAVFERGYSGAEDGTGLGLVIVEDIAAAHDWTVTVATSERGGVSFEFTDVDPPDT